MKRRIALLTSGWSVEYLSSVIDSIQNELKNQNTDLYIFCCYEFTDYNGDFNTTGCKIFDLIDYQKYDGAILLSDVFQTQSVLENERKKILKAGINAVSLIRPLEGLPCIKTDNYPGFFSITSQLIEEFNINRIAYIAGPSDNYESNARLQAYKDSLSAHNIPYDPKLVVKDGDWSSKFAYEATKKLLSKKSNLTGPNRIQAFACVNDFGARGTIDAIYELNLRVPQDIKVIGFDNTDISEITIPSISTVDKNTTGLAKKAVELVLSEQKLEPKEYFLKSKPIKKQSTSKIMTITDNQRKGSKLYLKIQDEEERFISQLNHTEDLFLRNTELRKIWTEMQEFYARRHHFEGPTFALILREDIIFNFIYATTDEPEIQASFGNGLQTVVNIENEKKVKCKKVPVEDLIPDNMKSEKSATYLFMPIYNHSVIHGYYVSKDNLKLLEAKHGYTWSRSVGANIEKFRQNNIYKNKSQLLLKLSTTDSLSGLMNRAGMQKFGIELFAENRELGYTTEIIFVDINSMKKINDKFGHLHGDMAIKAVAEEIKDMLPSNWIAIRYGGDEFVLIGKENPKCADFNEKLNKNLIVKAKQLALPYEITASVGYARFEPDTINDLDQAIAEVDALMYQEKTAYHKQFG